MSEQLSINCDHCGTKLNIESSYPHNWGIHVKSVDYWVNNSGATFDVYMPKPLKQSLDFCGFKCLKEWLNNKKLDEK